MSSWAQPLPEAVLEADFAEPPPVAGFQQAPRVIRPSAVRWLAQAFGPAGVSLELPAGSPEPEVVRATQVPAEPACEQLNNR